MKFPVEVCPIREATQHQLTCQDSMSAWSRNPCLWFGSCMSGNSFPFYTLGFIPLKTRLNNYNTSLSIGIGPDSQSWTFVIMWHRSILKHTITHLTKFYAFLNEFYKIFLALAGVAQLIGASYVTKRLQVQFLVRAHT